MLHYFIGTFVLEKRAFDFMPNQIINWPDGDGLIAFFKMLIAINKLYTYVHEGPDITFNTVEELRLDKIVLARQWRGHDPGRVRRLLPDYGSGGGDGFCSRDSSAHEDGGS